jgi:hypothetical protein
MKKKGYAYNLVMSRLSDIAGRIHTTQQALKKAEENVEFYRNDLKALVEEQKELRELTKGEH